MAIVVLIVKGIIKVDSDYSNYSRNNWGLHITY